MIARLDALAHVLGRVLCYSIVGIVCLGIGVRFNKFLTSEPEWPYRVKETKVYTPDVLPGGIFRYARDIDYFNNDCTLYYDRILVSLTPDEKGALRRFKLDSLEFKKPPTIVDDRLQSQDIPVPAEFPCGPTVMIDSPYAYCTRYQRLFNDPMRRKDAITKFNVTCLQAGSAP